MAGLRDLRKRLKSIRTTAQLAGAMRTAASAKYSRTGAALKAYDAYRSACADMLALSGGANIGTAGTEAETAGRDCIVLISGNRGLCGSFNSELLASFLELMAARPGQPPMVVACGRMAAGFCRDRHIQTERTFPLSDVPSYDETRALAEYLMELYASGAAASISFLHQRFINMLKQTPELTRVLPPPDTGADTHPDDTLYLPDRETVCARLGTVAFDSTVFAAALENAAGAQAATLMAMRSAYDNATESAAKLETAINRRRQSEVTASVIETASENAHHNIQ